MCLPRAEGLSQSFTATADEERSVGCRWNMPHTLSPVARKCFDGAGMYGQLARLGELGLPYGQYPTFEIDISIA